MQTVALERALRERQLELEEPWNRLDDRNSECDLDLEQTNNNKIQLVETAADKNQCIEQHFNNNVQSRTPNCSPKQQNLDRRSRTPPTNNNTILSNPNNSKSPNQQVYSPHMHHQQQHQIQMQQLLQQHVFTPTQLQQLMKNHSFYLQQQQQQHHSHHNQHQRQNHFAFTKKQLEQNMLQLQEQLQMNLLQQTHLVQQQQQQNVDKTIKSSTTQFHQQLAIQQQDLIQQLQIMQRQYLMHQEMGLQPFFAQQQGRKVFFLLFVSRDWVLMVLEELRAFTRLCDNNFRSFTVNSKPGRTKE